MVNSSKHNAAEYEPRTYRQQVQTKDMYAQTVIIDESDLQIYSDKPVKKKSLELIKSVRQVLESYIEKDPQFEKSLEPYSPQPDAPDFIRYMANAGKKAGVGPMAAVAGAVAQYVGEGLSEIDNVLIENGGDLYIRSTTERRILIHAGQSELSEKIGLRIRPEMTPCGICTSSGTIGHSLSFGKADAVVVMSLDTRIADAAATSIGNHVKTDQDISKALDFGKEIEGVLGILIIVGSKLGAWGEIEIC